MSHDDDAPDLLAGLRTGAWLDSASFPPLTYAVPGIIPEGLTLLVGPPKAGKSWLSLSLAIAVASGGVALGRLRVGDPRPVLLLALEDGDRRLQDRCRALVGPDHIPARLHYLTRIVPGAILATVTQWLDSHGHEQPLVIVDTLGKCLPPALPGESAYGRDYRVGGSLKRLVDDHPGSSLVTNHHDRKAASEDFVDSVSGTHGLAGAADTVILLARPRQSDDAILHVTGRDVEEAEYAVTCHGGVWSLAGGTLAESAAHAATVKASANLGDRSAEILRFVARHPEGVRAGQVATEMDTSAKEAGVYLGRLLDAGRVQRPERGLYTPVVSVVSVVSTAPADPPDTTDTTQPTPLLGAGRCNLCGFPLAAALVQSGETTHPTCQGETA
jgi:AAA domain